MFEEVFSNFLKKRPVYVFRDRLGISEKTVYSWCYPNHTPHGRKDPITRAVEVLDVIFRLEPAIGFSALGKIANRYGYRLDAIDLKGDVSLSRLMKETHDVLQKEAEAMEDGEVTPEEAKKIYKEIEQLQHVLELRKARLREIIERR